MQLRSLGSNRLKCGACGHVIKTKGPNPNHLEKAIFILHKFLNHPYSMESKISQNPKAPKNKTVALKKFAKMAAEEARR